MASALLEYLQAVRQQEMNRWTCRHLLKELDKRVINAQKEHENHIAEYPEEPVKGEPNKTPPFPEPKPREPRDLRFGSIFGYGILAAFGILIIITTYFTYTTEEYEVTTQSMLIALAVGLLFGVVLYLLRRVRCNRKWERYQEVRDAWQERKNIFDQEQLRIAEAACDQAYEQAMREYRSECDKVREGNQANDAEYAAVVARYQAARHTIEAEIKEIEHTLEQLYSIGIIHEKYYKQADGGLVPITMFCEYFDTGICTQLTGPDGAYNKYEQQQLANRIIGHLERIWNSVESIRANQYYLYRSINEVHQTVDRLSANVDKQATLQSYHTRLIADKADAMRSIEQDKLQELRALRKAVDN